jgi:hypothetical protein
VSVQAGQAQVLSDDGECLLRVTPDAVALVEIGNREPGRIGCLIRPRAEGGFVAFERPPGIEDPEALDAAILLEILELR